MRGHPLFTVASSLDLPCYSRTMDGRKRNDAIGCLVVFIAFSGAFALAGAIAHSLLWLIGWLVYWAIGLGGWRLWNTLDSHTTIGLRSALGDGEGAAACAIFWPWTLVMCGGEGLIRGFLENVIPKDDDNEPGD